MNQHPNKRQPGSLAESIAAAIRSYGHDRYDRRELELRIGRPLTTLERRAFNMAIDGLNAKTAETWRNGRPYRGHTPIPYDSAIARALPERYSTMAGAERRYSVIRDNGYKRIRRSKKGRYRTLGNAERPLDIISDQSAAVQPTRYDDSGTKYPEANFDEPAVNRSIPHRWESRPDMNVQVTRSAIGARYLATPGVIARLHKRLSDPVVGQSRYDGHEIPCPRPVAAYEVERALAAYLSRGGSIERIPAGMTGKRYAKLHATEEAA